MIGNRVGIAALLFLAACSPSERNEVEQEIGKNPEADAEVNAKARKLEALAEKTVKQVEARAKTEIDESKADAKDAAEASEPSK